MFKIYGQPKCVYCDKAKALLKLKGLTYEYVDLTGNTEALKMFRENGLRTVPQIWATNGVFIGGFDELVKVL